MIYNPTVAYSPGYPQYNGYSGRKKYYKKKYYPKKSYRKGFRGFSKKKQNQPLGSFGVYNSQIMVFGFSLILAFLKKNKINNNYTTLVTLVAGFMLKNSVGSSLKSVGFMKLAEQLVNGELLDKNKWEIEIGKGISPTSVPPATSYQGLGALLLSNSNTSWDGMPLTNPNFSEGSGLGSMKYTNAGRY